jgi:hypothetical protein
MHEPRTADNGNVTSYTRAETVLGVLGVAALTGWTLGVLPSVFAGIGVLLISGVVVRNNYAEDPGAYHRKLTMRDVRRGSALVAGALAVIVAIVVVASRT